MIKRVMAIVIATLVLCTAVLTSVSANSFADVNSSAWYYNDVEYVRDNNLMSGTSDSKFSPEGSTTRGMIVTVLWRLEGATKEVGKDFTDVNKGDWFYDAVAWASNNGIVSGYSETTFGPNDNATREQLAAIVYRYASYKKYDVSKEAELDKYVDKSQVSGYAEKSIKWANACGLINGTSDVTLSPKNEVQRAQLAAILKRFCVNIVGGTQNEEPKEDENNKPATGGSSSGGSSSGGSSSGGSGAGGSSSGGSGSGNTGSDNSGTGDSTTGDATVGGDTTDENNSPKPDDTEKPSSTEKVNFSIDKKSAKPGEEVMVSVNIENNPGLLGLLLTLSYDEDMCTLKAVKNGEAFSGAMVFTPARILNSGCRFLWDGESVNEDNVKDGSVLMLKFQVNDNASEGACNIGLTVNTILDGNLNKLNSTVTAGEITISK